MTGKRKSETGSEDGVWSVLADYEQDGVRKEQLW